MAALRDYTATLLPVSLALCALGVILRFLVIALSFLAWSCSESTNRANEDLIGTWIINHDSNSIDYSLIEYEKSGDKCEITFSLVNSLEVEMYWNKWEIVDGVIRSTMYNTTSFLEFGYEIQDRILKLNTGELFVDMIVPEGDYQTEYHYKNKEAAPGQICNTVKKVFKYKSKEIDNSGT
ncbi:hypothetical protein R6Y90_05320 [Alteromonas macleodii]|uniref:hypothetical protein n=1 Tax=Alteromonas macleodii TaxID=28108 RepID=UPI0029824E52|nr:hypothetical protein [Alteromonas macleodii]MDW5284384.1 hypothetical protein [Alteromonas macleodii]